MIADRRMETVMTSIVQVQNIYRQRGFTIKHLLLDGEFAKRGIQLNSVANNEHVPEIERYIRTLKERTCFIYNTLPFD
jgi:hypothetical protein